MIKAAALAICITIALMPKNAIAQCATPTCITGPMIGLAQNASVDNEPIDTQMRAITGRNSTTGSATLNCSSSPMVRTGATAYRWYAPNKNGEYRQYADSFCFTQGCSYQDALIRSPVCQEGP